jgi:hypothetical protein
MAERLAIHEIATLGLATDCRERGLHAARGGDLVEAAALIVEARRIYESEELSQESTDCAETFQTAESYVQYRSGDHKAAVLSMTRSRAL